EIHTRAFRFRLPSRCPDAPFLTPLRKRQRIHEGQKLLFRPPQRQPRKRPSGDTGGCSPLLLLASRVLLPLVGILADMDNPFTLLRTSTERGYDGLLKSHRLAPALAGLFVFKGTL